MSAENEFYFRSHDGLQLFYRDYPARNNHLEQKTDASIVLCLHGLTRNSRDFIELVQHLQNNYRVLTPDIRGRGFSAYDPQWHNYHPATYVQDVWTLLDHLKINRIAVIGTSLGALMAMLMAAQKPELITGMVLNDAGPEIDPRGLARIAQYAGKLPPVQSWQDAVEQAKLIYGDALPGLSEVRWLDYAKKYFRENADGIPMLDSDPNIGRAFREAPIPPTQNLWELYAKITATPMLVLRGETSDILSAETVARMQCEKPDLQAVEVANRGHAPLLDEVECVGAIDAFLARLNF